MELFVYDLFVIVKPEKIRIRNYVKHKYDGVVIESRVQKLVAGYPDWIYMPDSEEMLEDGFITLVAQKYELNTESTPIRSTPKLIPYINDSIMGELYGLEVGAYYLFRCEH
ncbi:hypothetical protein [Tepidimicrobium xylanilyticum]|uniref:Uncharacterized protein n=1 Tax=Tepidimicrobium xylanilyticum TaxID=1123352 RepID=A0A1H2SLT2_9FIRM|nr:hypothetical protein [Tepidimicrobium xylanilyticum]GMG96176.1 hypothetical protein EN5CB1_10020 [Tepidimicrobium xylanilyticum]SDW32633.1 hypothetical protein SAMN05660923_00487 [Tepidimicrobium xylanilyticum]